MDVGDTLFKAAVAFGGLLAGALLGRGARGARDPESDRQTIVPMPPVNTMPNAELDALRGRVTALEAERDKRDAAAAAELALATRRELKAAIREMTVELRGKKGPPDERPSGS